MMKKRGKPKSLIAAIATLLLTVTPAVTTSAQRILSLDSCRAMALRNNKQLKATKLKQDVAHNAKKAARTNYLPKIDILGGYEYFSEEVSILNSDQKAALSNIGTALSTKVATKASAALPALVQNQVISQQTAQQLTTLLKQFSPSISESLNNIGQNVADAFKTDTHNIFAGSVTLRQPIYMGGAIIASNKMADIAEEMAVTEYEGKVQSTLYKIDETYWLVVSLKQKKALAESYRDLVQKLSVDVHKMIDEGLTTRANGLKVDVKVNEADMAVTMVEDGLVLAKMLLCQQCGLPLEEDIMLTDENNDHLTIGEDVSTYDNIDPLNNRSELKLLQNTVDLTKQGTKVVRAAYLPQVLLTGGYMISNPNVFNGFQKKFSGTWNVGVAVRLPIWNWLEGVYKVRAGKATTAIAQTELNNANEMINLQVTQCKFKVKEANKRLATTIKNLANAEENLRCANVGFKEGVMESTEVMAAQTAWQAAQTQKIDAEIEVKLSQVNLQKALGILQ